MLTGQWHWNTKHYRHGHWHKIFNDFYDIKDVKYLNLKNDKADKGLMKLQAKFPYFPSQDHFLLETLLQPESHPPLSKWSGNSPWLALEMVTSSMSLPVKAWKAAMCPMESCLPTQCVTWTQGKGIAYLSWPFRTQIKDKWLVSLLISTLQPVSADPPFSM